MSKPRCSSDWNSCRRWVPEDEAIQFETPLDQLKQNIQDTLIKPNQEALVPQLLLIWSCLDSCCSFVFVLVIGCNWSMFLTFWVRFFFNFPFWFWRAARRSTWCRLRFSIDCTRHTAPIHTPFPFAPFPPCRFLKVKKWSSKRLCQAWTKELLGCAKRRLEGWHYQLLEFSLANSCKFNYIWVVKTWPLA